MARFKEIDDSPWMSVSDIMTGLMVIFLFIAVAYIRETKEQNYVLEQMSTSLRTKQDSISQIMAQFRDNRLAIYRRIEEEFSDDFATWGAEVDSTTLTVRFNGEATKFQAGRDYVPGGFKQVLDKFIPRYLAIVTDEAFKDDIQEIKIEGHAFQSGQGYSTILAGSQNRARNVLLYLRGHDSFDKLPKAAQDELAFKLTTTGMGYARMIDDEGQFIQLSDKPACKSCSRRVEFTIVTATERILEKVGGQL
jgi:outer membrane protein OmpA-like peptidoglycan-associated protein